MVLLVSFHDELLNLFATICVLCDICVVMEENSNHTFLGVCMG